MKNIEIYEVGDKSLFHPTGLKKGTKYKFFYSDTDLKINNKVFASLFAGKRIGIISHINEKDGTCIIDNKSTFISDIQYLII